MTSPYVAFPQHAGPAQRSSAWPVIRVILSVGVVLGCAFGYVIAGLIAVFTWTGCFIECTGTNHWAGAALGLLAVALLALGPVVVALLYRSRAWLWVAGCAAVGGAVLIVQVISVN